MKANRMQIQRSVPTRREALDRRKMRRITGLVNLWRHLSFEYLMHAICSVSLQIINRNFHSAQNQDLQGIDFVESPENSPTSWPADYQKRN